MAKNDTTTQTQNQNQTQNQSGSTTGTTTGTTDQATSGVTSSSTNPWAESKGLLTNLINKYSGLSTDVTGDQASAVSNLKAAASGVPNYGTDASGAISKLFGSDTSNQVGMLADALKSYKTNIGGTASGSELDPYSTPGFSDAIKTMSDDITNSVKSQYAASGRDPSGAGSFAGSLARGLSKGIAPTIQSQYNANKQNQMTAADRLFSGEGGTAGQITQQQQIPLSNAVQAVGMIPSVTSAYTTPAATQLAAANTEQKLPYENLSTALTPALSLAGAGSDTTGTTTSGSKGTTSGSTSGTSTSSGTSTGTATGTTSQNQNLWSNLIGGASGIAGLASLFSDKDIKTDIAPVGMLNDGQKVIRFRYKGDPTMRIGLLAQAVEKYEPEAVDEVGGVKTVNYKTATDKAAAMERRAA